MAAAIPAMMLAGTALSAYGSIQQGQAGKQAALYNASINEQNASLAHDQAQQDALQVRRNAAQAQGAAIAGYGASGVTMEGSPLDVLASAASAAKLDEQTVLYRGKLKELGFRANATLDRMSGKTHEQQGFLNAASNILTGIGHTGVTAASGQRRLEGSNSYAF